VAEVSKQSGEAGAALETSESEFVEHDRGKPEERDPQRVVMEDRNACEHQPEEDEIDGYAEVCHDEPSLEVAYLSRNRIRE
jgi:hypothetical protein